MKICPDSPDALLLWSAKEGLRRATQKGVEIALEEPGSFKHYEILHDIEELEDTIDFYESLV